MYKKGLLYLMTIMMVVVTSVCIVSCGDDEDNSPSNQLIGAWDIAHDGIIYEMVFMENGIFADSVFHVSDSKASDCFEGTYVIKNDSLIKYYSVRKEFILSTNRWSERKTSDIKSFRFSINGDELSLSLGDSLAVLTRNRK
jgi:hypothetical protein